VDGTVHSSAVLDCPENIYVADGARVEAGAVLVAEGGPIHLAPGAVVMAGAVVEGPVSVGHKSRIKILAKIYEGTSIGEYCKIGGEVENCIFQAYTSKQHDGFKGHSYYGEWINIGADSNNSDLKNNYSNVRVTIDGREIDTGEMFVGSTVGDHSKSGINCMFNTGTVVGVGCNLYGADFLPKYVPSFCWGGAAGMVEHDFEKFIVTAQRVMARRDRQLTEATRRMLQVVFEESARQRSEFLAARRS
jgi:UDP-N-acetylglucosamine diphosphorylase/glucosamine-1-phosphate N-acetyltransferase